MTNRPVHITPAEGARFSVPAIIAIICAIASFFVGSFLGLLLAIAAIIFGIIGAVMALAPSVRGGMMSIISIAIGSLAALVSIIRLILAIFD